MENKEFECPHCIKVSFCSRKCCESVIHQTMCNRMFRRTDCFIVRLAVEIIKNAFALSNDKEELIQFVEDVLFSKKDHRTCRPPFSTYGEMLTLKGSIQNNHMDMTNRVVDCLLQLPGIKECKTASRRILVCMATRHVATIRINSFSEEIGINNGKCINYSIHDVLSRVNHSCSPNVHHFYFTSNDEIRGITVRPIKKDEQIFINYLGISKLNDQLERQSFINKHWNFNCTCDKCRNNVNGNQLNESYRYIKNNLRPNECYRDSNRLVEECRSYLNKYSYSWSNAVEFMVSSFIFIITNIV